VGPHVSEFNRLRATPFDEKFPAIELHATVVDNILTEDHIHRPDFAIGLELALMIGFGLLATLLLSRAGSKWSVLVLGGCALGIWGGAHWAIRSMGIMISPMAPIIAIAGNFMILTVFKYAHEERRLKQSILELSQTQAAAIRGLATLAETRDPETGGHILRTQRYVKVLAQQLRQNPDFVAILDDQIIDQYFKMAPLHDIGKVGIPDNILLKPGRLSDEEFEVMKTHTELGRRALEMAQQEMADNPFFRDAVEIAHCHQEKWDGSGYPQGLKGSMIPLSARLMAVADVYDALTSKRVYKPPMPHNAAVQIIFEGKGSHFDPGLIDAFEQILDRFREIAHEFADHEEERQALRE
jgi:adenylate cyclase